MAILGVKSVRFSEMEGQNSHFLAKMAKNTKTRKSGFLLVYSLTRST